MVSALSGAVLRMKLDKARKAQSVEKDKLMKANALVRVLTERLRTDEKKAARHKLAGGDSVVVKKGPRIRFPSMCLPCCKRWLGEAGGYKHEKDKCLETEAFLNKMKTRACLFKAFRNSKMKTRK